MIPRIKKYQNIAIKEYQKQHKIYQSISINILRERLEHAISFDPKKWCFITPPLHRFATSF